MPKSLILAAVTVSALAFAVSANAETAKPASSYFEVGASNARIQGQSFGTVNFTIGKNLTKFPSGQTEGTFAVEAEGSIGVTHKDVDVNGVTVHTKVDNAVAGYAVIFLPLGTDTDLIGRLGYMRGQAKVYAGGVSATDAQSGPAIGVGIRYFPNGGNSGIRADVTAFHLSNSLKGDNYQVSYIRRF